MLIPLIIPIAYCILYKKNRIVDSIIIFIIMVTIVIFYWPVTNLFSSTANLYAKFLIFIILPIIFLFFYDKAYHFFVKSDDKIFDWKLFGINTEGLEKSLKYGLLFIPLMSLTTFIIFWILNIQTNSDLITGSVYFVESLSEEFLFRGILFLFLFKRLNLKVAYVTSLFSFILVHPQYFSSILIIITIVQGILTIEIVKRSNNLLGAWILHGFNRVFALVIFPFIMIF